VRKGECLSVIAKKYRISIKKLKKWNRLKGEKIYVGQRLIVGYKKVKPFRLQRYIRRLKKEVKVYSDKKVIIYYHIVKKGETLQSIARKYNACVEFLKELNHLKTGRIHPGQKIIISKKIIFLKGTPKVVLPEKPAIHGSEGEYKEVVMYKTVKKPIYHRVRKGEFLLKIAKKYKTSVKKLKRWNKLRGSRIYPGQRLIVGYKVVKVPVKKRIWVKKEKKKKKEVAEKKEKIEEFRISEADLLFEKVEEAYRKFLNKKEKTRRDWLKIIGAYRRIYLLYAGSKVAPKALFRTADLYYKLYTISHKKADLKNALCRYEMLIKNYPDTFEAEWAYYKIIKIYEKDLKDTNKAKELIEAFRKRYPHSLFLSQLESSLVYLNGKGIKEVIEVKPIAGEDYSRVIINLTGDFAYKTDILEGSEKKPPRIYVDIYPAVLDKKIPKEIDIKDSHLLRIRIGQYNKTTVRVVLDLKSLTSYKIFKLKEPYQLILDLVGKKAGVLTLARQFGLGVKTIVIDPGHGGKDSGAIGPNGLKEKDVVLKIAFYLKKILERELGVRVILTRKRDIFVPLVQRPAIANSKKADLFISIHLNASPDPTARGIETYYLNFTTDPEAIRVAALENAATNKSLSDLQDLVKAVLANTKLSESRSLAQKVQSALVKTLSLYYKGIENRGVKCAPFLVLVGARMPAILVEASFISNPDEARRLKNPVYLERIAEGIARGIIAYIQSLKHGKKAFQIPGN
jgi:N-acetylmuramoyl-L-alanine amidase